MNTYGEVKTALADWLDREDLTARIPQFVRLAETEIYRDLRCRENEFTALYEKTKWQIDNLPQGAWTTFQFRTLPPNFKEMLQVEWNDRVLVEISDEALTEHARYNYVPLPEAFAIARRNIDFIQPIPDDPADWEDTDRLLYRYYGTESLDALPTWNVVTNPVETPPVEDTNPEGNTQTDANTTRLLQVAPDLYIHGPLYFANIFLKKYDEAQVHRGLFSAALDGLRRESRNSGYSGPGVSVSNGRVHYAN